MTEVDHLFEDTYEELKRLARLVRANRDSAQTTSLLHRAYIKLRTGKSQFDSREHFLRVVSKAMRQLMIDEYRASRAKKRTPVVHWPDHAPNGDSLDLLALDDALRELEARDLRKVQLVELRFFAGCTLKEAASAVGISTSRAHQEWEFTKAWLRSALK